jgi:hypothetical protein
MSNVVMAIHLGMDLIDRGAPMSPVGPPTSSLVVLRLMNQSLNTMTISRLIWEVRFDRPRRVSKAGRQKAHQSKPRRTSSVPPRRKRRKKNGMNPRQQLSRANPPKAGKT